MQYELGVIGGGNMAEAILGAVVNNQIIDPNQLIVSDPLPQQRERFERLGILTTDRNDPIIAEANQVMLAVKPQTLPHIAGDLQPLDAEHQIVLSIMAGVSSAKIAEAIGKPARIIRIMPNTPLLAGHGMTAVALGEHAHDGDELLAMQIFQAAGEAAVVTENDMDAVTAVSGSGPAYVFYLAEAMTEAAETLGLTPELAALLAQQTILGAAHLMRESSEAPDELRRRVMSPGGTTEAAVQQLEQREVRRHIVEAIQAAAERSRQLGQ